MADNAIQLRREAFKTRIRVKSIYGDTGLVIDKGRMVGEPYIDDSLLLLAALFYKRGCEIPVIGDIVDLPYDVVAEMQPCEDLIKTL